MPISFRGLVTGATTTLVVISLSFASVASALNGAWTSTGSMTAPRYSQTAVLLQNGKTLISGGSDSSHTVNFAELYDPESGTWTGVSNMNYQRALHTATLLPDGRVLVAGGYSFGATAEVYDPTTGHWTVTSPMAAVRSEATATLLQNGKVLVTGGNMRASAEIYDPATNTWASTGSMNIGRSGHTATLLPDGKVLVVGGRSSTVNVLASAEVYDPSTGSWSFASSMTDQRTNHTATLLPSGAVLIVGGWRYSGGPVYHTSAELYNLATNTWTSVALMATARGYHTATLLSDGTVLVTGGDNANGVYLSSVELYNPSSNTWSTEPSMSTIRSRQTATLLLDGEVLVAGGYNNSSHGLVSAELYSPGTSTLASFQPDSNGYSFDNKENSPVLSETKSSLFYTAFDTEIWPKFVIDAWLNSSSSDSLFGTQGDCFGMVLSAIQEFAGPNHFLQPEQTLYDDVTEPPLLSQYVWDASGLINDSTLGRIVNDQMLQEADVPSVSIETLFNDSAVPSDYLMALHGYNRNHVWSGHVVLPFLVATSTPGQSYTLDVYDPNYRGPDDSHNAQITFTKQSDGSWQASYLFDTEYGIYWTDNNVELYPISNYNYDSTHKLSFTTPRISLKGVVSASLTAGSGLSAGFGSGATAHSDIPDITLFTASDSGLDATSSYTEFRGAVGQDFQMHIVPNGDNADVFKLDTSGYVEARLQNEGNLSISGDNSLVTMASTTGMYDVTVGVSAGEEAKTFHVSGNANNTSGVYEYSFDTTNLSDPTPVILRVDINGDGTVDAVQHIAADGTVVSSDPLTLSATADSTLRNISDNRNEGANPVLRITDLGNNRAVVEFDKDAITNYVTANNISKAQLVLTIADNGNNWGRTGRSVDALPLTESFTEGNGIGFGLPLSSWARGTDTGVTWECATDTNISNRRTDCVPEWDGGAYGTATAPTALITNNETGRVTYDVTQDVRDGRFGWVVKKTDERLSGRVDFYSREGAALDGDSSVEPQLILTP